MRAGRQRLSLRSLGSMLNVLPPEAVSLEALAEALRSKEFYVRFSAAEMLARRGDRDARLVLQDVLSSGDAPLRASAARHLHLFSWFVAEPLIRQALRDEDPRVRESAVYALCNLGELNAYELLAEVLPREGDDVRMAAAWGLVHSRDAAAVPALDVVMQAGDPEVRVKGLEALGANDTPEAIPVVRRALTDPDPQVQYAAALSLVELAGEACLPELADAVERTEGVARQQMLRGLFHATNYLRIDVGRAPGAEHVIDVLSRALEDPLPATRLAAAWPLAWMRHPRGAQALKDAYLREADGGVKADLVRIAAGLMSTVADEILRDAQDCADERVRRAAAEVLAERARGAVTEADTLV